MALTLIVETGSGLVDANSYESVAGADAFHETSLYGSVWMSMVLQEKKQALISATRILDEQVDWAGWATTLTQALRYPRSGVPSREALPGMSDAVISYGYYLANNVIPTWLKNATAELAQSLKVADRSADLETINYSQISVGSISLTIDKTDRPNVLPDRVIAMVQPYGAVQQSGSINLVRLVRG